MVTTFKYQILAIAEVETIQQTRVAMSRMGITFVVIVAVVVLAGVGAYGLLTESIVIQPVSTTTPSNSLSTQESSTSTSSLSAGNETIVVSVNSTTTTNSPQECAYIAGGGTTYGNHTVSVTNSTLGLKLLFTYDTNSTRCGEELRVPFELVNTLPRVNNLSVSQDWVVPLPRGMCSPEAPPVAYFVLMSGYYDYANVSKGTPIHFLYSCTTGFFTADYYLFQSNSSIVDTYGIGYINETEQYNSTGPSNDSAYYSTFFSTEEYHWSSTGLPVGIYTLAIEDQWGQILLWNFNVTKVTT